MIVGKRFLISINIFSSLEPLVQKGGASQHRKGKRRRFQSDTLLVDTETGNTSERPRIQPKDRAGGRKRNSFVMQQIL